MTVCALVLARGGSKGLPGKSIRPLGGHPLIAWSIAAARAARSVDRIVCSTDSPEIAAIARAYGAETPFVRPAEFATDGATDLDVFGHALAALGAEGAAPELFVQLRPTTPFREPGWIDDAVARMAGDAGVDCVRSVTPAEHTPYKMWRPDGDDPDRADMVPLLSVPGMVEAFNMPRQALPPVYRHTGQLDVVRARVIAAGSMTGARVVPLVVDAARAVDIDVLTDLEYAEFLFERAMPAVLRATIARAP